MDEGTKPAFVERTMSETKYDVAVIGSGPGGYVAAIRARQLGLSAVVIEKDKPGGVCLNIGCIPSKALIRQAEIFASVPGLQALGAKVDLSGFDYGVAFRKSREAAERLSKGVQFLLKKNKVEYVSGKASLASVREISVEGVGTIKASNIILATGSRPREIPGLDFDEAAILSSTDALMLEKLPERLLVLGAGAIGMEFAHIMSSFGVRVTLVEMLDRILPLEDAEAAEVLRRSFRARGIEIMTGTKAVGKRHEGNALAVRLEAKDGGSKELVTDNVLVAVGRRPNTEGIGLEAAGVSLDHGFVEVGDYYETKAPGVYAIGDLVATPLLAHVASKEGEIVAERIAGRAPEKRIRLDEIPSAVYCRPQLGSFGLSEAKAVEGGIPYKKAVFPYRACGKAVATEEVEGLVKLLFDPESGKLLGAHIAGSEATELIHELLLAKRAGLDLAQVADMIHAHPTLSEATMEAARVAEGWAIHI
jgi:dihydrolipoamide dehydrogenase